MHRCTVLGGAMVLQLLWPHNIMPFGAIWALQDMTDKFGSLMKQAADSGLHDWTQKYDALAAVLVFDQFSR